MNPARKLCFLLIPAAVLACCLLAACGPNSEEEYFYLADSFYDKGRFQEAVQAYQQYLIDFPEGRLRDRALFRSGEILYYTLENRAAGVKNFSLLVDQYPTTELAFKAREILAAAFRDETKNYRRAVLEYKWLLEQRPDGPRAPEYQFQAARCYLLAEDPEQAVLEFGRLLERYPDSSLTEQVFDDLGGAWLTLGQPDQALYVLRAFVRKYPRSRLLPSVEFKAGQALEEMYLFDDALKVYAGLLDRYDNREAVEIRIKGARERQKKRNTEFKDVDYLYVPDPQTLKESEARDKKTVAPEAAPQTPRIQGLQVRPRERKK
ncbi:MAG: tetratricopeptide repeat protein [Thermodesulfobacteriota bacterium]